MSEKNQFSSTTALGAEEKQSDQQGALERHPVDPKKRAPLKHLIKKISDAITYRFTLKQMSSAEGYLTLTRKERFPKSKQWS
jgi:hypothetical protein